MRSWKRSWIVLAGVLLVLTSLVLGAKPTLRLLGNYLVTTHPLEKAGAILLLSGDPATRAPEAARLFHAGYAPEVVFMTVYQFPLYQEMARQGVFIQQHHDMNLLILCYMGVPLEAITILDVTASSTFSEMQTFAKYLLQNQIASAIAVTSKAHTTRTTKIMRHIVPSVKIITHPIAIDGFRIDGWWRDRRQASFVINEYIKLINFWLWGDYWQADQETQPIRVLQPKAIEGTLRKMMRNAPCLQAPQLRSSSETTF